MEMRIQRQNICIRAPVDLVLTFQVILSSMRKLRSTQIQNAIESLIDELDMRSSDPDYENEPDEDGEFS